MLIVGSDRVEVGKLKQTSHEKFPMNELRQAQHILGMRIERNQTEKILRLSQSNYIRKVLRHFNMESMKLASTPHPTSHRLSDRDYTSTEEERNPMSRIPYASAIGSLMYAMVGTRSDLAYVDQTMLLGTQSVCLIKPNLILHAGCLHYLSRVL